MRYALTEMLNGGWRAECHVTHCWAHLDSPRRDVAYLWLKNHMQHKHRVRITLRQAMAV